MGAKRAVQLSRSMDTTSLQKDKVLCFQRESHIGKVFPQARKWKIGPKGSSLTYAILNSWCKLKERLFLSTNIKKPIGSHTQDSIWSLALSGKRGQSS